MPSFDFRPTKSTHFYNSKLVAELKVILVKNTTDRRANTITCIGIADRAKMISCNITCSLYRHYTKLITLLWVPLGSWAHISSVLLHTVPPAGPPLWLNRAERLEYAPSQSQKPVCASPSSAGSDSGTCPGPWHIYLQKHCELTTKIYSRCDFGTDWCILKIWNAVPHWLLCGTAFNWSAF